MTAYVYLLVRQNMNPEQQIIQAAHAAMESAYLFGKPADVGDDVFLVLLSVADEDELLAAQERLTRKGIRTALFFEPDHALGNTALASEPLTNNQKRKHFFVYPKFVHAPIAQSKSALRSGEVDGSAPSRGTKPPMTMAVADQPGLTSRFIAANR